MNQVHRNGRAARKTWGSRGCAWGLVMGMLVAADARAQSPGPAAPGGSGAPTTTATGATADSAPSTSAGNVAAPVAAPAGGADATSRVEIEARPGRGITFRHGDAFALTIRPRIQLRGTAVNTPGAAGNDTTTDMQVRTLRLWFTGHVRSPNVRFGMQLAFGQNDFEKVAGVRRASPIFDAYFELRHARDASVRVGQFFVPFDRLRTIREFSLQTVDRALPIRELTLDRDMGAMLFSEDLGGFGGKLAYSIGFFAGDGRNQFDAQRAGFLHTARFSYRPFGAFDDDSEGDTTRRRTAALAIGIAGAFNHHSPRVNSTTGEFWQLGTTDYVHGAIDLVFKFRGFSFMAEGLVRGSSTPTRTGMVGTTAVTETPGRAVGYVVQAGYLPIDHLEFWTRWDEVRLPWTTSAALTTAVANGGRELSGGMNWYVDGHSLKVQTDVVHAFGDAFLGAGTTQVHVQLDGTF